MGIFDRLFSNNANLSIREGYTPLCDHEAWVAILYTCISIDGEISDVEIDALIRLLLFKNKFADIEIVALYKTALKAKREFGPQHIIDRSAPVIKADDRLTVLALAAELILSDGIFTEKEKELLEHVASQLGIDEANAMKIIEVILIKNRDNRILN